MQYKMDLRQWGTVFRGLGNPNRLKILKLLSQNDKLSVSELADELDITLKNTSRNLGILLNLDLVEFRGKHDRVYYSVNSRLAKEVAQILRLVLKT
ncbi:ArsR family transcriptional regulator [bacterium]|nr:MAG: ArsR family transcriptional regulator [bacterium]